MKIISETLINVVHFARSIVEGNHSIPNINCGSFSLGRFGDHFRVGDHFGVGIISVAVHISKSY